MWKYNNFNDMYSPEIYHNADELYHYGVLGMKWGQHRIEHLVEKRDSMLNKNKLNKKYINLSNKIYLTKQKEKLKDAKKRKDIVDTIHIKNKIKYFKNVKNDTSYMDGNMFKSVYGVKKSTKQGETINTLSWNKTNSKNRTKTALKTIGSVGITALATSPYWYPKAKEGIKYLKNNKIIKVGYDLNTGSLNILGRKR